MADTQPHAPAPSTPAAGSAAPGAAVHRFPDFVCIGAQKAGTTWLHENLRRHPLVWLPPVKELQYFNELYVPDHRKWTPTHRREHGMRALKHYLARVEEAEWDYRFIARAADIIAGPPSDEWYGNIFTLATPEQICGEITPEYSTLPRTGIEHLLRLAPEVKIVLSLRDPIERSWSHLRMLARGGSRNIESLKQAAAYPDVADRGNYPRILDTWLELIPAERLIVIFMDDIASQPAVVMQSVCDFLGIECRESYFPHLHTAVHVGDEMAIPPELHESLKKQMRPVYEALLPRYPEIVQAWMARHYGQ
ncbi:MAG: sulfotransferase [Thiohalocapsa sp.]